MKSAWLQNRDQRDFLIAMTPNRSCNAPSSRSILHSPEREQHVMFSSVARGTKPSAERPVAGPKQNSIIKVWSHHNLHYVDTESPCMKSKYLGARL